MWYISSPEKAVVPGQCPDAGLFPSLTSGDAGVVKVEPGPAIFYLNTSSEDILLGSAPIGILSEEPPVTQPVDGELILPDLEMPADLSDDVFLPADGDGEEVPLDIACTLEDLKMLAAKMEVSIPVDDTHLEAERGYLDQTGHAPAKKKKKKRNSLDGVFAEALPQAAVPLAASVPPSPTAAPNKKTVCKLCNVKVGGGCEGVVSHIFGHHVERSSKVFPCVMCESQFTSESSIKKHVRNVHFRMEAFECPVCRKQIQQRSHLRDHITNVHGGKKALKAVLDKAKAFSQANPGFLSKAMACAVEVANGQKGGVLTATNTNSNDIMALNEVMKCSQCSLLITSKLHFLLHIKEVHGEKAFNLNPKSLAPPRTPDQKVSGKILPSSPAPNVKEALPCPVCSVDCVDIQGKLEHMASVHANSRSMQCELCSKVCQSAAHFNAHRLHFHPISPQSSGGAPIKCGQCEAAFLNTDGLLMHVTEAHPYQCPECPRHFHRDKKEDLKDHYVKVHINKDWVLCQICGKSFTRRYDMKRHQRIYHPNHQGGELDSPVSLLKANIDQQMLTPPKRQQDQAQQDTENEIIDVESEEPVDSDGVTDTEADAPLPMAIPKKMVIEDNRMMDKAVLRQLMNSVLASKPTAGGGRYPCEYCRGLDTFKSKQDLLSHIVNEHPFKCPKCPGTRMVKLVRSIQKHFHKKHPKSGLPSFCKTCTAVCLTASDLAKHIKAVHGDGHEGDGSSGVNPIYLSTPTRQLMTPIKVDSSPGTPSNYSPASSDILISSSWSVSSGMCVVCKIDFGSLKDLTDHVQEAHNYKCEACGREYKLADSIRKHCRKDHSDYFSEPIVCCRFCPTMFHTVAQKRDHISAVHGIKIAGHKYVEPVVSTEEDESSSAAEQYACPECDKHYANPDSLRKHAKSAHDKVLAYCRHCRLAFKTVKAKDRHVAKVHDGGRAVDNSIAAVVSPPKENSRKRKLSDEPETFPAPQASSAESQEEGVFACPKCPRRYSLQASLRKHCFRQHNHLAIKICRNCPRVFTKSKPFESHSKKCSDTPKTVASELLPPPSPPSVTTVKPVRIPFTKQASIKSFITPLASVKH